MLLQRLDADTDWTRIPIAHDNTQAQCLKWMMKAVKTRGEAMELLK